MWGPEFKLSTGGGGGRKKELMVKANISVCDLAFYNVMEPNKT
jgi:hypothetical protein